MTSRRGITLIELVVAMAIIVITAGVGIILLNPAGQLAMGRNTERSLDLQGIMNAVRENIADQTAGVFSCTAGLLPTTTPQTMGSAAGQYNIAPCLVPAYLEALPFDPIASSAYYTSNTSYDTDYTIVENSSTGQITIAAPFAELGAKVSITR